MNNHAALKNAELFRALDQTVVRDLIKAASVRSIAKNRAIFKQGDPPDHLFLVSQGKFKMTSLAKDGSQRTLRFMGPGEIIGCAAVFHHIPYPATATATIDSIVMSWTASQFEDLLRRYFQLAANALSIVGGRTTEMLQRLHEAATNTVEQRVARAVVQLAIQISNPDPRSPVQLRLSRQDLAELSDTSLFTVSRTIAAWSRAQIVEGGRQRITVRDLARLRQLAEIQG
ncbi:MAG: Crp/Fnr family transcriptional regulator [Xanthobacteraceae bacterium]